MNEWYKLTFLYVFANEKHKCTANEHKKEKVTTATIRYLFEFETLLSSANISLTYSSMMKILDSCQNVDMPPIFGSPLYLPTGFLSCGAWSSKCCFIRLLCQSAFFPMLQGAARGCNSPLQSSSRGSQGAVRWPSLCLDVSDDSASYAPVANRINQSNPAYSVCIMNKPCIEPSQQRALRHDRQCGYS